MDPGGSELDSSLPQPEKPCLIVEDSQPDSVALEDDPESSYRAVLARRLSSLQPSARSPVLELISSPSGSRSSQTDSQSESRERTSRIDPGVPVSAEPRSSVQDESQVLNICPPPNKNRCAAEDSRADSTTHCVQSEEGTSQFGFLQLSQSQDLRGHSVNSQEEDVQSKLRVQGQQDHKTPSSQQDLFDADRSGVTVDSTMSEEEHHGDPTPAHTLRLLHLSGQDSLVQESLSQSSVDYVAPTPLIIPSSPTEPESDGDESMDTTAPTAGRRGDKEEPMETQGTFKPLPSASTPVSQTAPGLVLERTLSLPSQPQFSQDVFVPTQSQETPQRSAAPCLQLSVSTLSSTSHPPAEDSQDTQIEDLSEPSTVTTCDSVMSHSEGRSQRNGLSSESQTPSKSESSLGALKHPSPLNVPNMTDSSQVSSVQATPPDPSPGSLTCQKSEEEVKKTAALLRARGSSNSQTEEEEQSAGGGASGMALVLSQSQLDSQEEDSVVIITDRDSQKHSRTNSSQPIRGRESVSTNGHHPKKLLSDRLSQPLRAGPEPEGLKDNSLSESSGEISFHFTLPKEGELIDPVVGATPPLITQLKQTLRHSTPIEISSFSEKVVVSADTSADMAMAESDMVLVESGGDSGEGGGGKLSLRMKLVTPVEEGSSERFSLQKPALSEEEGSAVKVFSAHQALNSSPSVFNRVTQVHRQQGPEEDAHAAGTITPVRAELFSSPQRSSQASSLGCNSLPNSQSEQPSQQEVFAAPQTSQDPLGRAESEDRPGPPEAPQTPTQTPRGARAPAGQGESASPSLKRTTGPAHRRHVRTIQEVRTTITRIITDVYYEDGKEVDRKVSQEREEPVVDCQVLDSDISPCRTGSSSLTSGDLADISSLSSKASSLQQSSGGTSSSCGFIRSDFILPPSRGGKSFSPRRGHRGHRGQGSALTADRGYQWPRVLTPPTPRGRARRGRPPSRSSLSRGGGVSSLQRLCAHTQMASSSEDEPPPRPPVSPSDPSPSRSDSLRSSPEETGSAGSSFVGLRVVAKWSSNGYFYSGRIIMDAGDAKFRLRFDDGYECEVAGKDILLCDPIPMETEVTALLEDQYFSVGVVKDYKSEGEELWYSVERDAQRQWYNRTSIILSLDQGNKLKEQHSLGPYTPSTPLTKASDISLDNLVEGKRRRRGGPGGENTPHRCSSSSPSTPGPSGKRKLLSSEDSRTPSKRGRRGAGARTGQRTGVFNTSGSGTDLPGRSGDDVSETHGPLPLNASLFQGFAFMLTASSENDRLTNRNDSEEEEDYVQTGPYNKTYTESQLQAGGGFVLPDFNEEQCKAAYQSLLIADQHCRTRKYILCVASGVPCVSHIWVRDCCKENKLLNYRNYLLPAGAGSDGTIIEWHPRCSPFRCLRVLLVFGQQVDLWSHLISLGGGSSERHVQTDKENASDVPEGKFDVVVTDSACPPLVLKDMTSQEVPLVSAEWLIQSVIRGERLGFHSNPQYRHDSSSV
ncbi:LOW QUALITY PROTEIN: TP53-binding protein 1 [Labrus bergylta]|uniref:LOW QUALITY PROTEIN: TP53-binding protein 1 n=1 Tax=Labrus bergylta TaxID=56723 RepID=UPI0033142E88